MRTPTLALLSGLSLAASLNVAASPAQADTRYLAYNAADDLTQAMTKGLTFEVERGWFGTIRIRKLFSTAARGSADLEEGGPGEVRRVLPQGASEDYVYQIAQEGDGRGLSRALCPSADTVWLVTNRVRAGRPLTAHAVGQWADGTFRFCLTLNYEWRGEWQTAPASDPFAGQ